MEKLVYLDEARSVQSFLERAAWSEADGLEIDLTEMTEDEFLLLQEQLRGSPVATKSLHYERTNTISLKEWELYKSQLEMLVRRAKSLQCTTLSVHPPRVEKETTNTMRDLETFVHKVDDFAETSQVQICFELTGFMKDPQLINIAFENLDDPALGVMIDVDALTDGIDPLQLLEKLDVNIHKVRVPLSLEYVDTELPLTQHDTSVVATSLD